MFGWCRCDMDSAGCNIKAFTFLVNPTLCPWIVFERDLHFIFFFLSNTVCFYTQRSRRLFICKSLIIANCVASSSSPSPVDFQHFLERFPLVKHPCRNHRLRTTTKPRQNLHASVLFICVSMLDLTDCWRLIVASSKLKLNVFLHAEQNTSVNKKNNE